MGKWKDRVLKGSSRYLLQIAAVVLATAALIGMGVRVWTVYRDALMRNQKSQMLQLTQTLAKSVRITMESYRGDLQFLHDVDESDADVSSVFRAFIQDEHSYIENLYWENESGKTVRSLRSQSLKDPVYISSADSQTDIWMYKDWEGQSYLVMKMLTSGGGRICLVIDEEKFYNELIFDIHFGANGYVAVTSSEGVIIMHPDEKQWGRNLVERRQANDPSGCTGIDSKVLTNQLRGESGISDDYSCWWTEPEHSITRKINAYYPAYFGNDFWTISAVTDYDDFYQPIAQGFARLVLIFLGILCIFGVFGFGILRLLSENTKAFREINYLRELNSTLEEMHRSEDAIAHHQRLQIMGTMTGGIAHEFNNFLTPIMGHAELLMLGLPEDSEEYDSAREIYEASEKARDVIRQMASFSRKNTETVFVNLEAARLLSRAFRMVESICPDSIRLVQENRLSGEYLVGNATQINQVILNIAANAVQAIGDRQGELRISACARRREEIKARELPEENAFSQYIEILIQDNGAGMTKAVMSHIFDPFFTTKKSGEGTGLGLALVRQIIQSHRGFLHVESKKGQGSSFWIYLPALEGSTGHGGEELSGAGLEILLMDDNRKVLNMLCSNLEKHQLRTRVCQSQEELMGALRERKPDAVVLDESIGHLDGISLFMVVMPLYPEVPRILMADTITREIAEARERGILDDYLEKPVSAEELVNRVRAFKGKAAGEETSGVVGQEIIPDQG